MHRLLGGSHPRSGTSHVTVLTKFTDNTYQIQRVLWSCVHTQTHHFPKKLVIFAFPSFAALFAAVLFVVALRIFRPPALAGLCFLSLGLLFEPNSRFSPFEATVASAAFKRDSSSIAEASCSIYFSVNSEAALANAESEIWEVSCFICRDVGDGET